MAQRIHQQIPVWVFPKRAQSINALLKAHPEVNVIISDDGLQHAGLVRWPAREGGRDLELVIEDERGIGNGRLCLLGHYESLPNVSVMPLSPLALVTNYKIPLLQKSLFS